MSALKRIAMALALAAPGTAMAATDGDLGPTSIGAFNASLQVNAPVGTQVQILGLDDASFGGVTGATTFATAILPIEDTFCLNRTTPGNVLLTISQTGNSDSAFNLNDGAGQNVPFRIFLYPPDVVNNSGLFEVGNGAPRPTMQSVAGCTAASSNTIAHRLGLIPPIVRSQNDGQTYGLFSGTFTVTVSPL